MMTVYIDSDCKCHVSDDGTMTAVQTSFFDGMCREFIEGYRFIPAGESWTRRSGNTSGSCLRICRRLLKCWR